MSHHQVLAVTLEPLGPTARTAWRQCAALGYSACSFRSDHPEMALALTSTTASRDILAHARRQEVRLAAIETALAPSAWRRPEEQDYALHRTLEAVRLAQSLAIPVVSVSLPEVTAVDAEHLKTMLATLVPHCDHAGVQLALRSAQTELWCAYTPLLGWNLAAQDYNPTELCTSLAKGLAMSPCHMVTLADKRQAGKLAQDVVLGEGQMPIKELLGSLAGSDFRGLTLVDIRQALQPVNAAQIARAYLTGWFPLARSR
ncbi:MAG: hypothetical protein WCJ97_07730 [Phycisphaerae bacterium]